MLRNYLKVAFRYLTKHKGYTAINIVGLAVGIACSILIMLFVKSELSFDRFHSKSDKIYRAWLEEHYQGEVFRNTVTPIPLGPVLGAGLPEAEAVWQNYLRTWTYWNHVRTLASVLAALSFIVGFSSIGR